MADENKNHDISMKLKMGPKSFVGISALAAGESIEESEILPLCDFVDARFDCADFRLITLIRVLYCYSENLSSEVKERIKRTVLGFRYWMDEPGDDSICWWSENHQILFFACQFLAGGLFPDEVFSSSGLNGMDLRSKARPRILRWLERRFTYGFVEWHSNTYYEEDAAPLVNLIDFAYDGEISKKATIILDLLLADMAMHSFQGLFSASSGRCYEMQKKHPLKQDTLETSDWAFGYTNRKQQEGIEAFSDERLSINLTLSENYVVPEILKEIARDKETGVIKSSMGINLSEAGKELGNLMDVENAGYYLWAMEAFTNPESVKPTMKMFRKFNMRSNDFLKDLKVMDIPVIRLLLPTISRVLNPATNGVAIQRANTYTWRSTGAMLSTAQNYHPGEFGDQQHIWQATLSTEVTVFTTHPGAAMFEDNARNFSPGYWVGNGIQPHAAQHENIVLTIYDSRGRKGFMESDRARYSHAWFPFDLFDEAVLEGNRAFGRVGSTCIALIGGSELELTEKGNDAGRELRQKGKVTWWVCELGNGYNAIEDFIAEMNSRQAIFSKRELRYSGSSSGELSLRYKGDFTINGETLDTDYPRLDSPYGKVERKPSEIILARGSRELHLDFHRGIREERTK